MATTLQDQEPWSPRSPERPTRQVSMNDHLPARELSDQQEDEYLDESEEQSTSGSTKKRRRRKKASRKGKQACTQCRVLKQKCYVEDQVNKQCVKCVRKNVKCTWDSQPSSTKPPILSLQQLNNRVSQLEKTIAPLLSRPVTDAAPAVAATLTVLSASASSPSLIEVTATLPVLSPDSYLHPSPSYSLVNMGEAYMSHENGTSAHVDGHHASAIFSRHDDLVSQSMIDDTTAGHCFGAWVTTWYYVLPVTARMVGKSPDQIRCQAPVLFATVVGTAGGEFCAAEQLQSLFSRIYAAATSTSTDAVERVQVLLILSAWGSPEAPHTELEYSCLAQVAASTERFDLVDTSCKELISDDEVDRMRMWLACYGLGSANWLQAGVKNRWEWSEVHARYADLLRSRSLEDQWLCRFVASQHHMDECMSLLDADSTSFDVLERHLDAIGQDETDIPLAQLQAATLRAIMLAVAMQSISVGVDTSLANRIFDEFYDNTCRSLRMLTTVEDDKLVALPLFFYSGILSVVTSLSRYMTPYRCQNKVLRGCLPSIETFLGRFTSGCAAHDTIREAFRVVSENLKTMEDLRR